MAVCANQAKKELVDRFVQSVSFHGPALVGLTHEEQGDAIKETALEFLASDSRNLAATSYFRDRLQICYNERLQHNATGYSSFSTRNSAAPSIVHQRLQRFIASKADLLFQLKGKQQLKRGVDYKEDSNNDVLDLFAKVPPLETFMGMPAHVRRWHILQLLQVGDIVLGEVSSKRPFGIFVELKGLEFGKIREFSGTDIQALCRTYDLVNSDGKHLEHKDPTDQFVIGDHVRGVVCGMSIEENQVSISFRSSKLPPQHQDINLGLIEDSENTNLGAPENADDLSYKECLTSHMAFNNPRNIDTLVEVLGIDTDAPCSLLRSCQRSSYPEEDYAGPLRKKQSAKWSMESTAKGIEQFKDGSVTAALKYLEHALQINPENVEAQVARGALTANEGKYCAAVKDFRHALSINGSHRNALKYLVETLIQQGIQEEKEGHLSEAASCFKEAFELDKDQQTARQHFDKVRLLLDARHQRKESVPGSGAKTAHRDPASKFSHVRQLIKEEQVKKRKKKKEKKKKRKLKAAKKRKNTSKARRHSRRSTDTDSDESTSTASETSDESSSETEWVQKPAAARNTGDSSDRANSGRCRKTSFSREDEEGARKDAISKQYERDSKESKAPFRSDYQSSLGTEKSGTASVSRPPPRNDGAFPGKQSSAGSEALLGNELPHDKPEGVTDGGMSIRKEDVALRIKQLVSGIRHAVRGAEVCCSDVDGSIPSTSRGSIPNTNRGSIPSTSGRRAGSSTSPGRDDGGPSQLGDAGSRSVNATELEQRGRKSSFSQSKRSRPRNGRRLRSKSHSRSSSPSRSRSRSRSRTLSKSRSRHRLRSRGARRRNKSRSRSRSRPSSTSRSRNESQARKKSQSGRNSQRSGSRSRSRSTSRSSSRSRSRKKSQSRSRSRNKSQSRKKAQSRSRRRSDDKSRSRGRSRSRSSSTDRRRKARTSTTRNKRSRSTGDSSERSRSQQPQAQESYRRKGRPSRSSSTESRGRRRAKNSRGKRSRSHRATRHSRGHSSSSSRSSSTDSRRKSRARNSRANRRGPRSSHSSASDLCSPRPRSRKMR